MPATGWNGSSAQQNIDVNNRVVSKVNVYEIRIITMYAPHNKSTFWLFALELYHSVCLAQSVALLETMAQYVFIKRRKRLYMVS
jgi:hypothetical protein